MSLSSALNSAMSGLTAASRASGIVSENLANVMTPGYARRSLELASAVETGPGVRITGVQRHADPGIISERRGADAEYANAQLLSQFHTRFEALVGVPGDPTSMGARLADFEASLISAASTPESPLRLNNVVQAANALTNAVNGAADGVMQMRQQADRSIDIQVNQLNEALANVQKLNKRITATQLSGGEIASFLDQRQVFVDQINEIVPVNQAERDRGQIALYTEGGAILLDGRVAEIEFAPTSVITPDMTRDNGALSGLEVDGVSVGLHVFAGGTIAANFEVRDDLTVSAQADLDSFARDLIERFETPGLDPTTANGDPGLFTDGGLAFSVGSETGLSGRFRLNAAVDPQEGGESWRLRAGLAATDPGVPGEARQLQALSEVLTEARAPASAVFGSGLTSAAGLASNLMSRAAQQSGFAEQRLTFATTSKTELTRIELAQGVDTDAELQTLMTVEQAYSANVRMIQAIDEMMETLLRL